jgi:pimeloyl-ACP methyl ester carboxylesterase
MRSRSRIQVLLLVCACAGGLFYSAASVSAARHAQTPQSGLDWTKCGQTPRARRTSCATATLPLDYDHPQGAKVQIAIARVPAANPTRRLGVLFFNFGGPGGAAVDYLQFVGASGLWKHLNQRYDIIGFDPRGVGQSSPAIDCHANQETTGIYSVPFATALNLDRGALLAKDGSYIQSCLNHNGAILSHVSTANVARDMDAIRGLLGESKLNYFGYSYGTFLGATYASMFPAGYQRMVLDGPVDATAYINQPWADLAAQTAAFERALGRFFQACAANQTACSGFGGSDPWDAYDQLVEQANAHPIPATGFTEDPRPVTGDDLDFFVTGDLYAKEFWGEIGQALAMAANGDGSLVREIVDLDYGRNPDGSYDPGLDRYFTIGATEQQYPRKRSFYFDRGAEAWSEFDHVWWNNGYVELNYGLWQTRDRDAYAGPFTIADSSPTPLVVATTYDPATPYRGALQLVHDLGSARLITMRGDGHTAYGGESQCIDDAVNTYLDTGALPPPGKVCTQDTPFESLAAQQAQPDLAAAVAERRAVAARVPGRVPGR